MSGITYVVSNGDLVYLDTLAGLVPVKIVRRVKNSHNVLVKATASRQGFVRGAHYVYPERDIVSRKSVKVRSGCYRIVGRTVVRDSESPSPFTVEVS